MTEKMFTVGEVVIGNIEVIGYCTSSYLMLLRDKADVYNKKNSEYIYWVVNAPVEKKGYYLVREKRK